MEKGSDSILASQATSKKQNEFTSLKFSHKDWQNNMYMLKIPASCCSAVKISRNENINFNI